MPIGKLGAFEPALSSAAPRSTSARGGQNRTQAGSEPPIKSVRYNRRVLTYLLCCPDAV
jgi:hypothetical protein